jgi:hypothetical protein
MRFIKLLLLFLVPFRISDIAVKPEHPKRPGGTPGARPPGRRLDSTPMAGRVVVLPLLPLLLLLAHGVELAVVVVEVHQRQPQRPQHSQHGVVAALPLAAVLVGERCRSSLGT